MSPPIKNIQIAAVLAPLWTVADMSAKRCTVTCHWDEEPEVCYVAETDVPGLATEAATVEEMEDRLLRMVPEVLALNGALGAERACPMN